MKSCPEDEVQNTVTEFRGVFCHSMFNGEELETLQILRVFLSF